ncbi:MAG: T9SS type A sorting domain-containing protein [Ignavibacteria bacterium]|nr:T9SS type A sorting domain-containing protein [Ignavibacteria bacterium]
MKTRFFICIFCIHALILVFSSNAFSQPGFSDKTDFVTGTSPQSAVSGDFNGDGKPDLAIGNYDAASVSVLLNTTTTGSTTPTFSSVTDFTSGTRPRSIQAEDINGDGKIDILVVNNSSNTFSVLLNITTTGAAVPSFSAKTDFTTLSAPNFIALGDLNGDGKPDVAVTDGGDSKVSVFINTTTIGSATPTFTAKTDFNTGVIPRSVSIRDLNGDGKPDLAIPNYSPNTISILLNTTTIGSSTPTFTAKFDFGIGNFPFCAVTGDINGDGLPDLASINSGGGTISVLLNTTTVGSLSPSFSAKTDFAVGSSPNAISIGDFNADGKPDLATSNRTANTVSVLLNTTTPGSATPTFTTQSEFIVGNSPYFTVIKDFNGDGKPDLAAANNGSNSISVLLNTTTLGVSPASFSSKTDFATGNIPLALSIADLNGDGKQDMVTSNYGSNSASVCFNTTSPGASTPAFSAHTDFTTGSTPVFVSTGDFTGDGKKDIVTANIGSNNISVLLNTTAPGASTPTFSAKTDFTTGFIPYWLSVGDLNGDGRPDIAVANNSSGTISVFLNTTTPGAGTPSFSARTDFTAGSGLNSVELADINGDGKPDMAGANLGGNNVSVYINTTTPGASTPTFTAKTDFTTDTQPYSVYMGDINGDGKPDMAVTNQGSNSVSVFLNTTTPGSTTPTFSAKVDFATGVSPQSVTLADLNGDGRKDILSSNLTGNSLSILINTTTPGASTPTFAAKSDYISVGSLNFSTVGDLNNDGKPDIASNFTTTDFSVILNTATYPLPVELASFTSSVNSNNVTLNWSTVQEQNNKGFEIERNSFGTGWKKVGYVEGHGTINTQQNYTFNDIALQTGTYNYRLKQIDYNGNIEYYELSNEVTLGVPSKYLLAQNYPNPFNPVTRINYELPITNYVSIKIFDITGKEVANLVNEVKDAGYYSVSFDAKSLSSSTYFYRLSTDKFSDVKKMVVVK